MKGKKRIPPGVLVTERNYFSRIIHKNCNGIFTVPAFYRRFIRESGHVRVFTATATATGTDEFMKGGGRGVSVGVSPYGCGL